MLAAVAGVVAAAMTAPEQIHLAYGGAGTMWVSWLDQDKYNGTVLVDSATRAAAQPATTYDFQAKGMPYVYTSPFIYHAQLQGLACGTKHTYQVCGVTCREEMSFQVPKCVGPDVATAIGFVGDLGQTVDSNNTIQHMLKGGYDFSVLVGDLSYADAQNYAVCTHGTLACIPERWDSWGRMIEDLAAHVPLQALPGNHETESDPRPVVGAEYVAYTSRMKSVASPAAGGPLYWSFASGNVHIIALNSYSDFSAGSPMTSFFESELAKVDRTVTPWLVVALHAPWYNSNKHHQHEPEEDDMRTTLEPLLMKYSVDVLYAGHVHAYERTHNVYNNNANASGYIEINIGDGGNREVLEEDCWIDPQPGWSAYRKRAFGHGRLETVNGTHAKWSWHQQGTAQKVISDSVWLIKSTLSTVGAVPSPLPFEFI